RRFTAELTSGGLVRVILGFNPHARVDRVCFKYAAPDYHAEYARVFGTAVCFEQPFAHIEFERRLLDAAAPDRDPEVSEAMSALAERRVRYATHGRSCALRMHDFLVQHDSARRVAMKTVAHALGLSVRSLRRRLTREGRSFESVREEALAFLAKRLL